MFKSFLASLGVVLVGAIAYLAAFTCVVAAATYVVKTVWYW